MRIFALALVLAGAAMVVAQSQSNQDEVLEGQLKQLFPSATEFSKLVAPLPHYKAYRYDSATDSWDLLGFAFWTTEIEPLERGYNGPIKLLVGMDTSGVITSVILVEHHEPYGYFSIATPKFIAQYGGKSIRDRFRFGDDIDAVSGATISELSFNRAVRNSARDVAKQLLTPEAVK
jgi:NosR/NirI family transcriptional regulator, nitrous oxide reductase regulator